MRCVSDLTCQIFVGAPAPGPEPIGTGNLAVAGDTGSLCLTGECRPIARCPQLEWTDEERNRGFADAWEARVLAPEK